ncbi:MAG: DUF4292 domain-containing protein [Bacteroidales bacterium]|nr:DUF4292 domain-containing protein [Candidatus Liminaster caballi]
MKKISGYILIGLVALMTLAGCHSSKSGAEGGAGSKELKEAKPRYETVVSQAPTYQSLQAKAKYTLFGKSLSGNLYLEHGKRICMTINILGIEMARIEANTEYVYFVNKMEKEYAKVTIADAASRLGLQDEASFDAVEALLLGQIFIPGQGQATTKDFRRLAWESGDNGRLTGTFKAQKYNLAYTIGQNNNLTETCVTMPGSGATVSWTYSSPVTVGNGSIPTVETLSAKGGERNISAQISLSKIAEKNWSSLPLSSYREISFADMFNKLKSLAGK